MSAKTKIVVLRRKELFITVVLTAVGVLLLLLLLRMLLPDGKIDSSGDVSQGDTISSLESGSNVTEEAETALSGQAYTRVFDTQNPAKPCLA